MESTKKPRRTFPREMMVSNDEKEWYLKNVFGKIKHKYPYISREFPPANMFIGWKYAKEVK